MRKVRLQGAAHRAEANAELGERRPAGARPNKN